MVVFVYVCVIVAETRVSIMHIFFNLVEAFILTPIDPASSIEKGRLLTKQ